LTTAGTRIELGFGSDLYDKQKGTVPVKRAAAVFI